MLDMDEQESGPGSVPEATLFEQAQAGCQDSLNTLMARHEGLVHFVVQRQRLYGLPYKEAVQAGRCGLWHAILGYDHQRGFKFATYAYVAIMKYVWAAVQSYLRRLRREVPLGVLVLYYGQVAPDPGRRMDEQDIAHSLDHLVARLPQRLRRIVEARYGLRGEPPQTLQEIGAQLGLTQERVRQLQVEALVWLRQPAHSQELRSLLSRHTQGQYELADELAQAWLRGRGGRHGRC